MDWFSTIVSAIIGILGALSGCIIYYRPKLKEAQALAKKTEVEADSARMEYLVDRIDRIERLYGEQGKILDETREKMMKMGAELVAKDEKINKLEAENKTLTSKVEALEKQVKAYKTITKSK